MKSLILRIGVFISCMVSTELIWAGGYHSNTQDLTKIAPNLQEHTYLQQIDHFGQLAPTQTFSQRYWIDSEFAIGPDAPVLYRIGGENKAESYVGDNTIEFAKQLGAHIVYLEHRYYGKSQPFADLSTEHLQFLTMNNVIEDLVQFQKWATHEFHLTGKWIAIGGSYSGALAAIYRTTHPEMVVGALASSAPIHSPLNSVTESAGLDLNKFKSIQVSDYPNIGGRQWAYQACQYLGFWMDSKSEFLEPSTEICREVFGLEFTEHKSVYDSQYYLPLITESARASNILFTNGSSDHWTELGLDQASNKNRKIISFLIENGGHHSELNYADSKGDSSEVLKARELFIQLAKQWLMDSSKKE
ncbi:MAG: S28 family serine protease [Pseudobdellovibrionaceae bacterium]